MGPGISGRRRNLVLPEKVRAGEEEDLPGTAPLARADTFIHISNLVVDDSSIRRAKRLAEEGESNRVRCVNCGEAFTDEEVRAKQGTCPVCGMRQFADIIPVQARKPWQKMSRRG